MPNTQHVYILFRRKHCKQVMQTTLQQLVGKGGTVIGWEKVDAYVAFYVTVPDEWKPPHEMTLTMVRTETLPTGERKIVAFEISGLYDTMKQLLSQGSRWVGFVPRHERYGHRPAYLLDVTDAPLTAWFGHPDLLVVEINRKHT